MFGQGDNKQERTAILKSTNSLLDYVKESTASLNSKLDAADRTRVSDYLDSVREIEIRVQKLEASMESMVDLPDAPLGAPDDFGELLDIQFEMMALAWQTNRTNVASMRMVKEASMRVYKNLGISEAFHPTSHWGGFPERIANLRLIQNYHTAVFAKFAERLKDMPDGDGSMLDHSIILFGSNMANSDAHNADPLPQMLVGRGGGVKGGQHLHYPQDTPHANLLVTILDRAGVPAEDFKNFADSTGAVLGGVIDDAQLSWSEPFFARCLLAGSVACAHARQRCRQLAAAAAKHSVADVNVNRRSGWQHAAAVGGL